MGALTAPQGQDVRSLTKLVCHRGKWSFGFLYIGLKILTAIADKGCKGCLDAALASGDVLTRFSVVEVVKAPALTGKEPTVLLANHVVVQGVLPTTEENQDIWWEAKSVPGKSMN